MSDFSCNFDMPKGVPLRQFNKLCKVTKLRTQLGLRDRFESEEVTSEFVQAFAKLNPKEQEKVLQRMTDRALLRLYYSVACSNLKEKEQLTALIWQYKNPNKRILKSSREFVLKMQPRLIEGLKNSLGAEWGDEVLPSIRQVNCISGSAQQQIQGNAEKGFSRLDEKVKLQKLKTIRSFKNRLKIIKLLGILHDISLQKDHERTIKDGRYDRSYGTSCGPPFKPNSQKLKTD